MPSWTILPFSLENNRITWKPCRHRAHLRVLVVVVVVVLVMMMMMIT